MAPKDEILIQLRDTMSESEIAAQLANCSLALHRLIQKSIDAGARGHLTYFTHLVNAAGAAESATYILNQSMMTNSSIVRPQ